MPGSRTCSGTLAATSGVARGDRWADLFARVPLTPSGERVTVALVVDKHSMSSATSTELVAPVLRRPRWPAPGRGVRSLVTVVIIAAAVIQTWIRLSDAFYFHHDDLLE